MNRQFALLNLPVASICGLWMLLIGGAMAGQSAIPVRVAEIAHGTLVDALESVATVIARESIDLTVKETGFVESLHFAPGRQVAKGDLLVQLDASQRIAELGLAQARRDVAQVKYERAQQLVASNSVSRERIDELQAEVKAGEAQLRFAEARLRDLAIRAPFAGVTGLRRVSPGALVRAGDIITTLDDISQVRLLFNVPERRLSALRVGQQVTARSVAWPDIRFSGAVSAIDTRVATNTRTVTVEALLDNTSAKLRAGLFMSVSLAVGRRDNVLLLPETALLQAGSQKYVYRVEGGHAVKSPVEIGRRLRGEVEVKSGLDAGDRVVIEGALRLKDGRALTVLDSTGD